MFVVVVVVGLFDFFVRRRFIYRFRRSTWAGVLATTNDVVVEDARYPIVNCRRSISGNSGLLVLADLSLAADEEVVILRHAPLPPPLLVLAVTKTAMRRNII